MKHVQNCSFCVRSMVRYRKKRMHSDKKAIRKQYRLRHRTKDLDQILDDASLFPCCLMKFLIGLFFPSTQHLLVQIFSSLSLVFCPLSDFFLLFFQLFFHSFSHSLHFPPLFNPHLVYLFKNHDCILFVCFEFLILIITAMRSFEFRF